MTTGSQGEPMSGLARMSVRDHASFQIVPGDTVVISATPIPGNEKSVHKTINNLCKLGAIVIHGTDGRSHVSGHASQEELLLMLNLVRPEFFVPVHGEYRMLDAHKQLAVRTGVEPGNVFVVENGDVLRVYRTSSATRSARRTAATSSSTVRASATSAKRCCAIARRSRTTAS